MQYSETTTNARKTSHCKGRSPQGIATCTFLNPSGLQMQIGLSASISACQYEIVDLDMSKLSRQNQ